MPKFAAASIRPRGPLRYFGYGPSSEHPGPSTLSSKIQLDSTPPEPFYHDAVFICIDLEKECVGPGCNSSISEIGISLLDTRDLTLLRNNQRVSAIPPGDRGCDWFPFIRTTHFRILDNLHDNCKQHWCRSKGAAAAFGFGTSVVISSDLIRPCLDKWLDNALRSHLRPGETKRYAILCSFDSHLEEKELRLHDIMWVCEVNECWDIQKMKAATRLARALNKQNVGVAQLLEHLGINVDLELLHNGGNDSAFELQAMIAGTLLRRDQWEPFLQKPGLSQLPRRTWSRRAVAANKEMSQELANAESSKEAS